MWVGETTSTQDAVRTWAMAQYREGSSLVAEHQTEGRGRLGRSWVARPGQALQLSILLRPDLTPAQVPLLSLAAAVAVRMATRSQLGIKWPNDLLGRDGRKVAGILAEADVSGGEVKWVVIGVGINVRGAPSDVPEAACLEDYGPPQLREDIAVDLIATLVALTRRVEDAPHQVLRAWRRGACMLDTRVRVGDREGVAVDVAEDGALLLRMDSGAVERVVAGDVQMVDFRGASS